MSSEGDLSALVAAHGTWLSAFLRGLVRCEADAEDAFQEVWMRVLKGGGLGSVKSERAYLARVARSVVIDRFRRVRREELTVDAPTVSEESLADRLPDDSPTPAARCERAATREDVIAAVRELPEGLRETVLMRIEGELSFQEIADELGVPLGTALTWMRSATMKLRKRLGRSDGRRP